MNPIALKTCLIGLCFCLLLGLASGADNPAKEEDQSAKAMKERATAQAKDAEADQAKNQVEAEADKNLSPAEQQFADRLKPMLKAELRFAAHVCNLDKDQCKVLATAGDECVIKTAKQFANPHQGGQVAVRGRIIMFGGVGPVQQQPTRSGRDMLQQALSEAIKAKFPVETATAYANELLKRTDARKQLVVACVVVMLDKRLILTAGQRREISQALMEHFDETWSGELGILLNNPQYFPQIPDDCLVPHLRDSQRKIWESLPNKNVQFGIDPFDNDPINNLGIQVPEGNDDPFN